MPRTRYDAIVLGTGGVGSAALYHLAQRGIRVLGLDPFAAGHDRGSSHGQTRIIRQAYFEHPRYVPLLRQAYRLWRQLETASGRQLFIRTGLLEIGPADGALLSGIRASAAQHQLEIQELTARQVHARFPGFTVPDQLAAIFEPTAGFLLVEDCVRTHIQLAIDHGAHVKFQQPVERLESHRRPLRVHTAAAQYETDRLIVAAGPWCDRLLSLPVKLQVLRKHLHWYHTRNLHYRVSGGCPAFFFELDNGYFYGFPAISPHGLKVAEHSGGEPVADPTCVDRTVDRQEQQRVENFLHQHLPQLGGRHVAHAVCMYTMSPDEHFLVDHLPDDSRVVFAAGLSGHGFKFTSVLGQLLAELALDGTTSLPIDFLRLARFQPRSH